MKRPSWDEYFMNITNIVLTRSTCLRRQVGAVLVKDRRILATGYNGAPSGIPHCSEVGCIREEKNIPSGERLDICRASHAEANCIAQAARHGGSIYNSTIYCTYYPCLPCVKLIINAGITRLVYGDEYPYPFNLHSIMLNQSSIRVVHIKSCISE